jgi:hypothetical protein
MAKSRSKPGQREASKTAPSELPSIPAPEPLPDFDSAAFTETCTNLTDIGSSLIKRLSIVLAVAQEAAKSGAIQGLHASETSHVLPTVLDELDGSVRQSTSLLNAFHNQFNEWRNAERRTRRARFEKLAKSMDWKIAGSWPEPVVRGIVFVSVDDSKDKALINGRLLGSPTAERLIRAVTAELETLNKGLTAPAEFASQAWAAYKACGASPGNAVAVHDLLARMTWQRQSKQFHRDPRQESFRGYPLAQFRADLTNYLASGSAPVTDSRNQYELEIAGGSFAEDGIFMYFPQSNRLSTCGRVTFQLCPSGEKQ